MTKIALVILDGMTPAMLSSQNTPALVRFSQEHCHKQNAYSVFPSETRVAATSLVTGCWPEKHGLPANYFFLPGETHKLNSGQVPDLRRAERAWGRLLAVPDLGEILTSHQKKLTSISGGSAGNCALLNWDAQAYGHRRYSLWHEDGCDSPERFRFMQEHFGDIPRTRTEQGLFSTQTLAYLEQIIHFELQRPDAADIVIAWLPEPDDAAHHIGLSHPEHAHSLARADAICARIIHWWEQQGRANGWQLLFCSDHGHVPIGKYLPLCQLMQEAGFDVSSSADTKQTTLFRLHEAASAHVHLTGPGRAETGRLVRWLMQQPWCGSLLLHPRLELAIPGTLPASLAGCAHSHGPDIHLTLRDQHSENPGDCPTTCASFQGHGYVSTHGGLLPDEMAVVMLAGGHAFKKEYVSRLPAGIVDLAPTLLHLLDIPVPDSMQGRVLHELLHNTSQQEEATLCHETWQARAGTYIQEIIRVCVEDKKYVVQGRRLEQER